MKIGYIYIVSIIIFTINTSFAQQLEIQWQAPKPYNINLGSHFLIGNIDDNPQKEIVWFGDGSTTNERIVVLDAATGSTVYTSDVFHIIVAQSAKLEDVDKDGKDEIIFAGQQNAGNAFSLFTMKLKKQSAIIQQDAIKPYTPPVTETPQNTQQQTVIEPVAPIEGPKHEPKTIGYNVPFKGIVKIEIFNGKGELINTLQDQEIDAGIHSTTWDGKNSNGLNVPNGTYFLKVSVNNQIQYRNPIYILD